ncbi:MAG: response regulator [Verrucomicrobiae bacterium]|nr:response regulator [Verrucomicrobiae bacterium]
MNTEPPLQSVSPTTVKILTIDDSRMVHAVLGRAFRCYNVELCSAQNGREGLGLVAQGATPPDLIVLDINMPEMDGLEFLRQLRGLTGFEALPVVLLSADSGRRSAEDLKGLGAQRFVSKPFTEQQILEVVMDLLPLALK